jgi:hypothetical protein
MLKNCKGRSLNGFKKLRMLNNYKRRWNSKITGEETRSSAKEGTSPSAKEAKSISYKKTSPQEECQVMNLLC